MSGAAKPPETLRVDVSAMRRRGESHGQVEADLSPEWLASVLADTDAEVRDGGKVSLALSLPTDGPVIASGKLALSFVVPCGRCLEDARVDGDSSIDAMFVLGAGVAHEEDDDGLALDEDALDTWPYDGSTVDLTNVVTEYVKVAYPMRALCELGEECQGLCSGCGNNFNLEPPRLAGSRAFCVKCGQEFFGAVGEPPVEGEDAEEPPKSNALADALSKIKLRD